MTEEERQEAVFDVDNYLHSLRREFPFSDNYSKKLLTLKDKITKAQLATQEEAIEMCCRELLKLRGAIGFQSVECYRMADVAISIFRGERGPYKPEKEASHDRP